MGLRIGEPSFISGYIRATMPFGDAVQVLAEMNLHAKGYTIEVSPPPTVADLARLGYDRNFVMIDRELSLKGSFAHNRWLLILGHTGQASIRPNFKSSKQEQHYNKIWSMNDPFAHTHPSQGSYAPYPSEPDIENWQGPLKDFLAFVFNEFGIVKIIKRPSPAMLPSEMQKYDQATTQIARDEGNHYRVNTFSSSTDGLLWVYFPWQTVRTVLVRHGINVRSRRSLGFLMGKDLNWPREIGPLKRSGFEAKDWMLPEMTLRDHLLDFWDTVTDSDRFDKRETTCTSQAAVPSGKLSPR